ncbi:MAG: hypothetical protein JWO52_3183 [Gammaproteobacteria bacterium]|nr:hypothetical protein [Gammaproteobacteria bacterium]
MTTRRQHYVWQAYLEAWTTPKGKANQLWCLRRKNFEPFLTDTKNVAVERDFYRVRDLHEGDAEFVRWLSISPKTNEKMRDLAEGWISRIELFLNLMRSAKSAVSSSERLLAELDAQMIEFQENEYNRLESDAVTQLDALRRGDVSFFDDAPTAHLYLRIFRWKNLSCSTRYPHPGPRSFLATLSIRMSMERSSAHYAHTTLIRR